MLLSKSRLLRLITALGIVLPGCIIREPKPASDSSNSAPAEPAGNADLSTLQGIPMVAASGLQSFTLNGETAKVELTPVAVEGQPFKEALRADVKQSSNSEWSVQLQAPTAAPVQRGDVLLATFYVRASKLREEGTAETQFVFERAGAPYTKSVTHTLRVDPEWRKVQVPFTAVDDHEAGQAQMIFRLGYDPQTLEIGGINVENFGKKTSVARLPSTKGQDRLPPVRPVDAKSLVTVDGGRLEFEVSPQQVLGPISPYVYGINSQNFGATNPSVRRMGGNRQTVYNWELNASNAGNDYRHVNDNWPCTTLGYKDCTKPGAQMVNFVLENQANQSESLLTIPLIDFASADTKGPVSEQQAAPSPRFLRSHPRKPTPYSETPDLSDGAVYQDEFVNFLVRRFGKAARGGPKFYALDNEPALWPSTHPRVHPKPTTYREIIERTEALAAAITEIDPSAELLGGVMFGMSEFLSLSSAPDADEFNAAYGNYVEYFLASLKELEQKYKRRLVHVLDIHWYPEIRGTARITEKEASPKTVDARLSAARSLWDASFRERSWITDQLDRPIRLIPWFKEMIAKRYPGTKLALTEYNFGAGEHISGGLAQADVLGVLGREGLYLANYWGNGAGVGELPPYIKAAFKLYRNYDGQNGRFGDTAIASTTPDLVKASIHAASQSSNPSQLTILIINKDQRANYQGQVRFTTSTSCGSFTPYRLDITSPELRPLAPVPVAQGQLEVGLPALSATLLVCRSG